MFKLCIFVALIAVASAAFEGGAATTNLRNSPNSGDGSYNYAFDTSNGISQQESGLGGQSAQGSFNYVSPEGQPIQISYVADQFGYRAAGSAIPVAPEIPPAIARALAYIAQVNPSGSSEPGLARSSFKQPALRFTAPSFF